MGKGNGLIMFKRLPEEFTLLYVFKDGQVARVISLSSIYSFLLAILSVFKQCTFCS